MSDQPHDSNTGLTIRRYADHVIVVICLIAGALAGSNHYQSLHDAGRTPWFYQVDFGPAVMWTCGRGFVVPEDAAIPALQRFLQQEVDQFSCADMPAQPPLRPSVGAQPWLTWSHLMRSAAIIWSVVGISWSALSWLAGAFFGATMALAYLLMRLVSGRLLSVAGACFVLTSPLFLAVLPQFRDFSKVPFMLGLAWLMAQLLVTPISSRRLLGVAAGYGALAGVAIGFRNDALITIPPFVLLLAMARPSESWHGWRPRLVALAAAVVAFIVLAIPVLRAYSNGGGSATSHAAFRGMMSPFDSALSVSNGGLYEVGYGLDDSYAAAVISGYASRRAGALVRIDGHSRDYDAAAASYIRSLLRTLPGDSLTRAYAALDYVVGLPSGMAETQAATQIPALRRFVAARARILLLLWWVWLPAVVAAILLVSLRDLRLSVLLAVLFVYFCSYPAIQFDDRHVLQLALIPIAAAAYVLQTLVSRRWGREWRNAIVLVVIGITMTVLPLLLLRGWQDRQIRGLIQAYLSAPAEPVELTDRSLPDDRIALDFDFAMRRPAPPEGSVPTNYLIAEFDASACRVAAVDLTLRYEASHAFADFTRRVTVSLPRESGSTRVTMATFSYGDPASASSDALWYRPKGYEIPAAQRSCLTKLSRLREPSQFPVLLNTTLPGDWEQLPLHLTLSRWEHRPSSTTPAVYLSPPDLQFAWGTEATGEPLHPNELADVAGSVSMPSDGRLLVNGVGGIGGVGAFSYLAQFQERHLARGRRLVVEGDLKQGGLSAGWVTGGTWTGQTPITQPGPFVAVFEVPADGNYSFVIANNLKGATLRNVCEITRLAWLP